MRRGWTVSPVVTMFLLAACQGGGDDASQGAEGSGAVGEGIEVDETAVSGTVRFRGFRSSDAEEELLQATLDAFSEKYPNIEVDYEPIPEGYIDQMTAQFSAGEPPDLFYSRPSSRMRGSRTGSSSRWIRTSPATRSSTPGRSSIR